MSTLLQKIDTLPKEIQLLIDEYNVEYRPKMYNVLKIFKDYIPYRKTCGICDITKIGLVLYSYSCEEFICSNKCNLEYIL